MKTFFLSVIDGLFHAQTKENSTKTENNVFLTSTDAGRTLIIEEDAYSVWVHVLSPDRGDVDFEGFLCSVVDSKLLKKDIPERIEDKKEIPLPISLSNHYSYVRNLKNEDIQIDWEKDQVSVYIRNVLYLIMDLTTKTSYSKSLAKDCIYGKILKP
ncbi:hypothetical protein [Aquimarina sp. 2304DJ70-9]|uniref:hypothetical protein n=1 Tax=Aquimarina penaris TaxID=3231044 RepID=UPI0034634C30